MADKQAESVLLNDPFGKVHRDPSRNPAGIPLSSWLLLTSWPRLLIMAATAYLFLVALFAVCYLCGGATARPGCGSEPAQLSQVK